MFQTYVKNYQTGYLSKTWQKTLQQREVAKNNYHATGNIKKAKAFVQAVSSFTFQKNSEGAKEQITFQVSYW